MMPNPSYEPPRVSAARCLSRNRATEQANGFTWRTSKATSARD
jgi:hypothetical protein